MAIGNSPCPPFKKDEDEILNFFLQDEFITDDAAPIATPRTCEPDGKGTLNFVQNDGSYAIVNKVLTVTAQGTPAWTDLGFYHNEGFRLIAGTVLFAQLVTLNATQVGFPFSFRNAKSVAYGFGLMTFYCDTYNLAMLTGGTGMRNGNALQSGSIRNFPIMLRNTNGAYYIDTDALIYSGKGAIPDVTYYLHQVNYDSTYKTNFIRAGLLPATFRTAEFLCSTFKALPVNGDTFTVDKDSIIYIKWTVAAGEIINIRFRRVNDDNCMILRCDQAAGWMRIYRRQAAVETQLATVAAVWTVGNTYRLSIRFEKYACHAFFDTNTAPLQALNGYNINKTGVKIDGFATGADLEILPVYVPDKFLNTLNVNSNPFLVKTRNIINVPDGAALVGFISQLKAGDVLSLAPGGTYNIGAGLTGISDLPSGHPLTYTEIRGNGATIINGASNVNLQYKWFFRFINCRFRDATVTNFLLTSCRNFDIVDCYADTNVGVAALDVYKFDKCTNFIVRNCEAAPSTGVATLDGFELYGECGNGTFYNCVSHGINSGYEIWTGAVPNWINYNIEYINCNAHDCLVGFSTQGGVQNLNHENIIVRNAIVAGNAVDYEGINGATLYKQNSPGTINGSVIDI